MAPLLEVLGCDPKKALRLDPLPHMLQKGRLARKYSRGILEKASAWCEIIGAIKERPSTELQAMFLEVVDPGEALLFATVAELEGALVATGDKSACVAIATESTLSAVRPRLAGKVLCLETALEILLDAVGFQGLARNLTTAREFNQTIRLLLPEAQTTSEDHFRDGLSSYLREITTSTGPLLYAG
jgi:hypothetical protein